MVCGVLLYSDIVIWITDRHIRIRCNEDLNINTLHIYSPFSDIVIPVCSSQEEYCSDCVGIEWSCCEWS